MKRWLAMMGCVSLAATGCASTHASSVDLTEPQAREVLLHRTSAQVTYRRAPEEVMAAVRAVLEERGYRVLPSTDPDYVHTAWNVDSQGATYTQLSQYLVAGQRLADGRFLVRAHQRQLTNVGGVLLHPTAAPPLPRHMIETMQAPENGGINLALAADTPLNAGTPEVRRAPELEWAILSRLEPRFTHAVEKQVDVYVANHRPPEEVVEKL